MNRRQFLFAAFLFLIVIGVAVYATWDFFNALSGGFAGEGKGDFNIVKTLESPDEKYFATFWNGMGGGAAGWCRQYINVYKKEEIFDLSKSEENQKTQVFDVRCSSEVEMNWENAGHLHIVYSVGENGTNAAMESKTGDGKVKISYEIK